MLKNIDFEKMSYEEGLALVAETRKNALKRGHVKQANNILESLKKYWRDMPEEAKWSLYGSGVGGLGGLASSLLTGKKRKHYLRNILTGGLLGGLAGYGGRLGYTALQGDSKEQLAVRGNAEVAQRSAERLNANAKSVGMGTEGAVYTYAGLKLGNALESALLRKDMISTGTGGFKIVDEGFAKHLDTLPGGKEFKQWLDTTDQAGIQRAFAGPNYLTGRKAGPLYHILPRSFVGSLLKDNIAARGISKIHNWLRPNRLGPPPSPDGPRYVPKNTSLLDAGGKPIDPSDSVPVPRSTLEGAVNYAKQQGKPSFLGTHFGRFGKAGPVIGAPLGMANLVSQYANWGQGRPLGDINSPVTDSIRSWGGQ